MAISVNDYNTLLDGKHYNTDHFLHFETISRVDQADGSRVETAPCTVRRALQWAVKEAQDRGRPYIREVYAVAPPDPEDVQELVQALLTYDADEVRGSLPTNVPEDRREGVVRALIGDDGHLQDHAVRDAVRALGQAVLRVVMKQCEGAEERAVVVKVPPRGLSST